MKIVNRRLKHTQIPLNPDPTANVSPHWKWNRGWKKGFSLNIYTVVPKPYHFLLLRERELSIPFFRRVSDLYFSTIMGKGPGLYFDIGKKTRGISLWIICVCMCMCICNVRVLWFNLRFWIFFGYILVGFRSSVQGLPERPEVHHHYLFFHWSCKLFCLLYEDLWLSC